MKLLIFGGNGYIGGECVHYLLEHNHEITLANRGHWPWDGGSRIRPRVKEVFCDRLKAEICADFKTELTNNKYDAVIDFSATEVNRVEPFYDWLRGRADVYIYISSDSCYEVCQRFSDTASREEHAVRPEDPKLKQQLAEADAYGNGKLEVEEFLARKQQTEGGIPFVFLRLPDVLGERDTTDRWWKYQMWMEHQNILGETIYVPKSVEKLLTSYVDVVDVADVLQTILTSKISIRNEIFNVSSHRPMTLSDLLNLIKTASECFDAKIQIADGEFKFPSVSDAPTGALKIGGDFYFPSVTRGPIDVEKIRKVLNWRPQHDFSTRAKQIAKFYKTAWNLFPAERKEIGESLLTDLNEKITTDAAKNFRKVLNS